MQAYVTQTVDRRVYSLEDKTLLAVRLISDR